MRRHVGRLRQIGRVLARYGLAPYLRQLGLPVPLRPAPEAVPAAWPERLRAALGELGPTFVKLGQLLAARADLLPPEYAAALQALRDEAPPVPADEARREVERALGRPLEAVFARFEAEPLAAASVGQVHAATLRDGREVLVKVRRPGIEATVRADLALLAELVRRAERRIPAVRDWDLPRLVDEFARILARELDLRRELRHMVLFARAYGHVPGIRVPRPYPELCAPSLLVMERLPGVPVGRADLSVVDRRAAAARLVRFFLEQVFDRGFFHADLHPGNVLLLADGTLGILDFGQVGWLEEEARQRLVGLLAAVMERDYRALAEGLLEIATPRGAGPPPDPEALRRDLVEIIEYHDAARLGDLELRLLLADLLDLARRHRLRLPWVYALTVKGAAAVEGTVRLLDPELDLRGLAAEYAARLLRQRLAPSRLLRAARRGARDAEALLREGPGRVRSLLRKADEGRLAIEVRHGGLEPLLDRLHRVGARVSGSLVLAALIVGASLVARGGGEAMPPGLLPLVWAAYGAAVAVSAWLLWTGRRG